MLHSEEWALPVFTLDDCSLWLRAGPLCPASNARHATPSDSPPVNAARPCTSLPTAPPHDLSLPSPAPPSAGSGLGKASCSPGWPPQLQGHPTHTPVRGEFHQRCSTASRGRQHSHSSLRVHTLVDKVLRVLAHPPFVYFLILLLCACACGSSQRDSSRVVSGCTSLGLSLNRPG